MRARSFTFLVVLLAGLHFGNCRCSNKEPETAIAAPAVAPAPKQQLTLQAVGRRVAVRTVECAKSTIRVVDGDTLYCGRDKIRVLGVDTPETHKTGRYAEQGQEPHGGQAKALTEQLVREATMVLILFAQHGDDKGRGLAHVLFVGADGQEKLLALELLRAGLAYETCGHYGDNGFAEFCRQIKAADAAAPRRMFQKPWKYKKERRR